MAGNNMVHKANSHSSRIRERIVATPENHVVSGVNYELPMVDQFMAHNNELRSSLTPVRDVKEISEKMQSGRRLRSAKERRRRPVQTEDDGSSSDQSKENGLSEKTTRRKSTRERSKKDVVLARTRVRYDMDMVPIVKRNKRFLSYHFADAVRNEPRRSSRLFAEAEASSSTEDTLAHEEEPQFDELHAPSVWIPTKRYEWEDSVPEMTALCSSAMYRRLASGPPERAAMTKPFHMPLSRAYIFDRVDIDDPLNGFQLRHKHGWLLGFVLWTNFTTWTHGFRWDSTNPVSGMYAMKGKAAVDRSGELAALLEAQPRSGDPLQEGFVFPTIAEIALLGGLGCGEYLLRMALESIKRHGSYKFVVLQATDSSRVFYEKFGFVRVGAICQYMRPGDDENSSLVGYRHWTHANESQTSLQKHGGPSYMMCLRVDDDISSSRSIRQSTFLDRMLELSTDVKPQLQSLVSTSMPASTRKLGLDQPTPFVATVTSRRKSTCGSVVEIPVSRRGRRPSLPSFSGPGIHRKRSSLSPFHCTTPSPMTSLPLKRSQVSSPLARETKRIRLDDIDRSSLLAPPPKGSEPTYAQKQYQSKWLAVPPIHEVKLSRPPPKPRCPGNNVVFQNGFNLLNHQKKSDRRKGDTRMRQPKSLALDKRFNAPIDRSTLFKQKVKAYPRSQVHYFNRVVRLKKSSDSDKEAYYFVLQYDMNAGLILIIPLVATGTLTGKREGRPRYQAEVLSTESNFKVALAEDYEVVKATMVMKTPVVACEAWDIV